MYKLEGCPLNFHLRTDDDFDRFVSVMKMIQVADANRPGGYLTGVVPGFLGRVMHVSTDRVDIAVQRRPDAKVCEALAHLEDCMVTILREAWTSDG